RQLIAGSPGELFGDSAQSDLVFGHTFQQYGVARDLEIIRGDFQHGACCSQYFLTKFYARCMCRRTSDDGLSAVEPSETKVRGVGIASGDATIGDIAADLFR